MRLGVLLRWVLTFQDGDNAGRRYRGGAARPGQLVRGYTGCAPEASADTAGCPGTYIAGLYNRLPSRIDGRYREDESLVNVPNWLPLTFRAAGGPWLSPGSVRVLHEHWALDLWQGVLRPEIAVVDPAGRRTRLTPSHDT